MAGGKAATLYLCRCGSKQTWKARVKSTTLKETQEAFQTILNPNFIDPIGKLKFHIDGSSKGDPGQSGYGGLLRDEVGT
ncbi:hypothetical protein ACSBR1_007863 [Camellia fascicularis]